MPMLLLLLLLCSCASPTVVERPAPVSIPVSVPCRIEPIAVPALVTTGITGKSTMFQQAQALAAVNEQRKAYELVLQASLKSCQ